MINKENFVSLVDKSPEDIYLGTLITVEEAEDFMKFYNDIKKKKLLDVWYNQRTKEVILHKIEKEST